MKKLDRQKWRRLKRGTPVFVDWEDAYTTLDRWFNPDDHVDVVDPVMCATVGFVMETRGRLALAQSVEWPNPSKASSVWVIPWGMVHQIRTL